MARRLAGIVVKRIFRGHDNWTARAFRPTGTEIDFCSRTGHEIAFRALCHFLHRKPEDFVQEKISEDEYHYVPLR